MPTPPTITKDHLRAALACVEEYCQTAREEGFDSADGWYVVDRLAGVLDLCQAVVDGDAAKVERLAPAERYLCQHPQTHNTTVMGKPVRVCLSCHMVLEG